VLSVVLSSDVSQALKKPTQFRVVLEWNLNDSTGLRVDDYGYNSRAQQRVLLIHKWAKHKGCNCTPHCTHSHTPWSLLQQSGGHQKDLLRKHLSSRCMTLNSHDR
jgi:hypothetical protein